jgi:hypothetical protein
MLNEDYKEILQSLADEKARFLLIGAYAMAAHGYPRATMDIEGIEIHIPSLTDLIRNKKASGRTRDLADAEALEVIRSEHTPENNN